MTYKVILHNNSKALRQEPEMEEPNMPTFDDTDSQNKWTAYHNHLSDCAKNIIDIAPDFQGHWELGQSVKDSEFRNDARWDSITKSDRLFAMPITLLEEKEEGLLSFQDLIDWTQHLGEMGWYMEKSGKWVHDDETGHFETTKDLVEHYRPIQKNEKEEGLWISVYGFATTSDLKHFLKDMQELYHITNKSKQ